jgi:Ca-activated chloride channel family protein
MKSYWLLGLGMLIALPIFSQTDRAAIRRGNQAYQKEQYERAESQYKAAEELKPGRFATRFNLGNTLYQQERWEDAAKAFQQSAEMTENPLERADALHNLGNALIRDQKFEEAAKAYKESLKLNPKDEQTRYNLAQALRYIQNPPPPPEQQQSQDQSQQKQEQDSQENNPEQPQDGDQEQQQDQGDSNPDNQDDQQQQQPQPGDDQQESGEQNRNLPDGISKEEAERLLDALDREEQNLQDQMRMKEQKGKKKTTEKKW